jgi:hypothetical protein
MAFRLCVGARLAGVWVDGDKRRLDADPGIGRAPVADRPMNEGFKASRKSEIWEGVSRARSIDMNQNIG